VFSKASVFIIDRACLSPIYLARRRLAHEPGPSVRAYLIRGGLNWRGLNPLSQHSTRVGYRWPDPLTASAFNRLNSYANNTALLHQPRNLSYTPCKHYYTLANAR